MPPLPRQPLFALAEQMPLAVLATRVYLLDEQGQKNWLLFAGHKYALVSAQRLPELEEAYEHDHAAELEQYKRDFLQTAARQGILSAQQMMQLVAEDRILDFLVKQMIPRLHRLFHWSAPPPRMPDLESGYARPQGPSAVNERRERMRGLLGVVLGGDLLFLDERSYSLKANDDAEAEADGLRDLIVSFRGRNYRPSASAHFLYEIEQVFQERLAKVLEDEALREAAEQAEQLRKIKAHKERLLASSGLRQSASDGTVYLYRDELSGIIKSGPDWWVYLEIPEEFVYEDHKAPGTYYRFDPTRVGVKLTYNPSSAQVSFENARLPARAAYVLKPGYEHMYVDARNSMSICMGAYNWGWWTAAIPLEDAICRYLLDAKSAILAGYRPDTKDTGPVNRLEKFPHRRISLEEIQRRGLRITNRL